jgi:hypothetical protein
MPRSAFLAAAFALPVVSAAMLAGGSSGAAAPTGWSGSASCTITVAGDGYQHAETQRWQVNGPTHTRAGFLFVGSSWTDRGSGSSEAREGNQTRDIEWTVNASAAGRFQFVVRASDGKLLIGQANAQLRVAHGVTGQQKLTIGGVEQTPGTVDLEAFETQLPPIVVAGTSRSVSGSTSSVRVKGSFAPFQPAAATVKKSCTWRFAKAG